MAHQAKEIMRGLWIGVGGVFLVAAFLFVVYLAIRARSGQKGEEVTSRVKEVSSSSSQKGGELATRLKEVSSIPKAELPVWKPNSRFLGELHSEVEVEGYRVRPPRSYSTGTVNASEPGEKIFFWSNRSRRVKWSMFHISIIPHPAGEVVPAPERTLDEAMNRIKLHEPDVSEIVVDKGLVNGMVFLRTRYTATNRPLGRITHRFSYETVDDGNSISIYGEDEEPNREDSLAEAAALTFRKP